MLLLGPDPQHGAAVYRDGEEPRSVFGVLPFGRLELWPLEIEVRMLENSELRAPPWFVWIKDVPDDEPKPVGRVVDVITVQRSLDVQDRTHVCAVRM